MIIKKLLLGLILFGLGLCGVLSLLTMDIPIPEAVEALLSERFTPQQISLLLLVNPTLFLLISVLIGTIFYQKVNFKLPLIEKMVGIHNDNWSIFNILKYGILGGIVSGLLLSLLALIFEPLLPAEFLEIGETLKPSLAARFLYGGITEEILLRFGIMTFIVYIGSKLFRTEKPIIYWFGIIVAAILFALGHFPIAYQSVAEPSSTLLSYILIGNTIGGLIFGWLYWKKGLESAMVAHIFAHVTMLMMETLFV